ncbi:protein PHLOEM PROTEIN 2-LIKE A10-like [Wolffia australiana]
MDLPLWPATLAFLRRRRRWLLLLAAASAAGFGAYKAYHLPAVAEKRRRLAKLLRTAASITAAVSASAETLELVSGDVNRFLRGDSDVVPPSLRQLSKLARSYEFARALARVSESVTVGVLHGLASQPTDPKPSPNSSVAEKLADKLFSTAGSGFASVVVGSFARNLVMAAMNTSSSSSSSSSAIPWVDLLCAEKLRPLIGDCIQAFVGTAVTVYLDKTMDLNAFDDLFSGLANPKHSAKVKEVLVSLCNGAVETLVKTSHHVLACSGGEEEAEAQCKSRWVDVPSNRSFVLDLTGRVTAETVKSFLDVVPAGVKVVGEEIKEKGAGVMRYFAAKSLISMTVCLALCLHLFSETRVMVPA